MSTIQRAIDRLHAVRARITESHGDADYNDLRDLQLVIDALAPLAARTEPPIEAGVPKTNLSLIWGDAIAYGRLKSDGDMRSWMADQLYEDLRYTLVVIDELGQRARGMIEKIGL